MKEASRREVRRESFRLTMTLIHISLIAVLCRPEMRRVGHRRYGAIVKKRLIEEGMR